MCSSDLTRLGRLGRLARLAILAAAALLALAAAGCAQAPSTTRVTATATVQPGSQPSSVGVVGPILGTVEVWLDEYGILLWQPRVDAPGAYRFEITNVGREPHDLTVLRWDRGIEDIPERSGRALLQGLDVVARSSILQPDETGGLDAMLDPSGDYVLLSSRGSDFGQGMVTTLRVGAGSALPAPMPTPEPNDDDTVRIYLLDHALFLVGDDVDDGLVSFLVQNIGPSAHDLVVVRWRGDPWALPVDAEGHVLLDSLTVVGRLDPIQPGEEAMLDVELQDDLGYVAFSSLPGDYQARMAGQVFPR